MKISPLDVITKQVLPKFYNTIDDSIMLTYPIFIDQLDSTIELFNSCEEFQNFFINKLDRLKEFVGMQMNWRIAIKFFNNLKKIEILFYKFVFTSKLYEFVMKILNDDNYNIPLKNSAMSFLPYILKYGKKSEKEEILKYVEREILENKNFYKRRIFFSFFEEAIKIFSVSTLLNNQIIDNALKFFNDNRLMQSKLITILKNFYPLIHSDTRLKFIINNKLDNLKKLGIFDYEIKKVKQIKFLFRIIIIRI